MEETKKKQKRDFWSKFEAIGKFIGSILIPFVIFYVGYQFNKEKEDANKSQREFENTVELLRLCHNQNSDLRVAGFGYAIYLQRKELLEDEIITILSQTQAEEKDSETALKTGGYFETIISNAKDTAKINRLDKNLATRVYVHINQESQRIKAKTISSLLESKSDDFDNRISVPGIEHKVYAMGASELRVFKSEEIALANEIAAVIRRSGTPIQVVDLSKKYSNANIRPRHFEVWFGNDFE